MRPRTLLGAGAMAALAWAAVAAATGGIDAHVGGLAIRARGAQRPLALGLVLLSVYAVLERRRLRHDPRSILRSVDWIAPWIAATLVAMTTINAIHYGAFTAGGSDTYGYLSEAYGWAKRELPGLYTIPLALPLPQSDWLQIPIGYWPGRLPHTMAPSYAPGLPLLMAIGIVVADPVGPYLVVPLCAGLLVWVTFQLARRVTGPVGGVAAALLAATSPVVLFLSICQMSDVPAGAMWTGATAGALANSRRGALAAGLYAAIGLLIRPNLAPLAVLPLVFMLLTTPGAERWRRAAVFSVCVAAAAIAIGALNAQWYGSPLLSGYGNPSALYRRSNVWPNLKLYLGWLWESQSPWIFVAAVSLIALVRPSPARAPAALLWSMVLGTLFCYLPYNQYDAWWWLRFLLPAFGALFALVALALRTIAERVPRPWGHAAAALLLGLMVWHSIRYTTALNMYGPFKASEHRYADLGVFIASWLPADAIVFSMQHGGGIRYYGGRHTLRYDLLEPGRAGDAPLQIERLGFHPYLAIEDGELPAVRKTFGIPADAALPWPEVARMNKYGGLSIFDLSARPSAAPTVPIEPGIAPPYSAPVRVAIEPRAR